MGPNGQKLEDFDLLSIFVIYQMFFSDMTLLACRGHDGSLSLIYRWQEILEVGYPNEEPMLENAEEQVGNKGCHLREAVFVMWVDDKENKEEEEDCSDEAAQRLVTNMLWFL